ncbi:hypothetical protein BYT27DRAFT_7307970 [Phlegmacium glaucopus]|nr:hypothetical protein BYT27DRAFT_7307970 [Phlegmacium glaucopus]
MDRMFAKPFADSLCVHINGIEVLVRQPGSLTTVASGSWDGGLIVHNLPSRQQTVNLPQAHKGKVSGLCFADGDRFKDC